MQRTLLTAFVALSVTLLVASTLAGSATAQPARGDLGAITAAGSYGNVIIWPNGTISNKLAPISQTGTTYKLTGTLNGSIEDLANGTAVEGNGHIVNYTVGEPHGDNAAISINGTHGVVVQGFGGFTNDLIGVHANGTSQLTILGNRVQGARAGVFISNSTGVNVLGNNATNDPFMGFLLWYSSNLNLSGDLANRTYDAVYGSWVYGLSEDHNLVENTTGWSTLITYSQNVSLRGNEGSHANNGFEADYSSHVLMEGNNASYGSGSDSGLGLYYVTDGQVLWNVAISSSQGIWVEHSLSSVLANNSLPSNTNPIYDYGDTGVLFAHNYGPYSGGTAEGIYTYYSQNVTFLDNNLTGALQYAAYADDTNPNTRFLGNDLSGAGSYGLYILDSYGSMLVAGNDLSCSSTKKTGVYADGNLGSLTVVGNQIDGCAYSVYDYSGYAPDTVSGNSMNGSSYGIYIEYSYGTNVVQNNRMNGTGYGTYIYESNAPTLVLGNFISNSTYGVFSEYAYASVTVNDNKFLNYSRDAVYTYDDGGAISADGNRLVGASRTSTFGVYIEDNYAGNVQVNGNFANNTEDAVYIYDAYGGSATMNDNVATGVLDGLWEYYVYGGPCTANGNLANDTYYGVVTYGCYDGATMVGNVANDSHYGIYAYDNSNSTVIAQNTATNSTMYGIYLGDNYGPLDVTDNQVRFSSNYGIYSDYNYGPELLAGNDLRNAATYGIYDSSNQAGSTVLGNDVRFSNISLYSSFNNYATDTVALNDFAYSQQVYVDDDRLNGGFYGNNLLAVHNITFFQNTLGTVYANAFNSSAMWVDGNLVNANAQGTWNASYPTGGNYWTGYHGVDLRSGPGQNLPGSDGIGDTPFVGGNVTDQYPLMGFTYQAEVAFVGSGLPAGATWGVTLGGATVRATSSATISFPEDAGAWSNVSYSVLGVAGYQASPLSGVVWEKGAPLTVAISFVPFTYAVNFTESGLPAGTSWSVAIGAQNPSSTHPWLALQEPNGTYAFTVGGVPGYTTTWSGSVTVNAAATAVAVAFSPVLYPVQFQEAGLPSGSSWSVTVGTSTLTSTGSVLSFDLANGTASYKIGGVAGYVAPWSGTVSVTPSTAPVEIAFVPYTYLVTFQESGLPAGTSWTLAVGGTSSTGTTTTLSLPLANGTYAYAASPVTGFATGPSGTVTISGAAILVNLTYRPMAPTTLYSVVLEESGLPAGTPWSATLGTTVLSSSSSVLVFHEPNGTLSLSLTSSGFRVSAPTTVLVKGSDLIVPVQFSQPTFSVTFGETGLPAGSTWFVSLGSVTLSSTSSAIVFNVANGTSTYVVGGASGYTASPSNGQTSVNGQAVSVSISFHGVQKAAGLSSLDMGLIGGLVALLVLAAIGWFLALGRRRGPSTGSSSETVAPPPTAEGTGAHPEEGAHEGEIPTETGKDGAETSGTSEPTPSPPPPPPAEEPSTTEKSAAWESSEPPAPAPPAPQ